MAALHMRQGFPWLAVLWLAFLCALGLRLVPLWENPPFSPDSWSYWELAQTVGGDFYRIHTWRQFQFTEPWGVSFPPLWPLAIAAADALTGLGFRSALALNAAILIALAALLQAFGTRFLEPRGSAGHGGMLGLLVALALVAHRSAFEELSAGRSMPLALLLYLLLLWQLLAAARAGQSGVPARMPLRAAALGATAALATLNRFDFLPALLLLGLVAPWWLLREHGRWGASMVAWWAAAGATLAPWITYCVSHFGRPFVSDNSRTVLAAVRVNVDDFLVQPPPTLFDLPAHWLAKTAQGIATAAASLAQPLAVNLLLLALFALLLLRWRDRQRTVVGGTGPASPPTDPLWRGWWLADLAVAAQLGAVLLTGFTSIRYALALELHLLLRLGAAVLTSGLPGNAALGDAAPAARARAMHTRVLPSMLALLASAVALQFALLFAPPLQRWLAPPADATPLHTHAALAACLRAQATPRVLFLTDDNTHAYRFGALYGIETLGTPHNHRTAELDVLVRRFAATHVYVEQARPVDGGLAQRLGATLMPVCGRTDVYRIALAK
jgi:hypothetical protein